MTDAVTKVKERIAKLADDNRRLTDDLGASRCAVSRLRGERDELVRGAEHADREMIAARDELAQDRRNRKQLLYEREALIRDLDAARRKLIRDLEAAQRQLTQGEDRLQSLATQLHDTKQEREAAVCELGEATSALEDIRDQLRSSLDHVTDSGPAAHIN